MRRSTKKLQYWRIWMFNLCSVVTVLLAVTNISHGEGVRWPVPSIPPLIYTYIQGRSRVIGRTHDIADKPPLKKRLYPYTISKIINTNINKRPERKWRQTKHNYWKSRYKKNFFFSFQWSHWNIFYICLFIFHIYFFNLLCLEIPTFFNLF